MTEQHCCEKKKEEKEKRMTEEREREQLQREGSGKRECSRSTWDTGSEARWEANAQGAKD